MKKCDNPTQVALCSLGKAAGEDGVSSHSSQQAAHALVVSSGGQLVRIYSHLAGNPVAVTMRASPERSNPPFRTWAAPFFGLELWLITKEKARWNVRICLPLLPDCRAEVTRPPRAPAPVLSYYSGLRTAFSKL